MKARCILISTILALISSIAVAGLIQPAPVIVDLDNRFAQGDMWTARTSNNDVEFIGCGFREFNDSTGTFEFGFCQAEDVDGNHIVCFTENPDLVETMRATSDFSFITFNWDESDECTKVGFSTQSFYLPNFKVQKGMGTGDDDD